MHSTRAVLKGHLWFLSSIMECIDEQTGILPPRPNSGRAVVAVKADDRFAQCPGKMKGAGIGRDDQVAPIQNGDETTQTTTECFLRGMETFTRHLFAQG